MTAGGIPCPALHWLDRVGVASGNAVTYNECGIKVTVQSENVGIGVLVYLQFQ